MGEKSSQGRVYGCVSLYSDAWPSYPKINEVAHTGLLRSKCREIKIHTVAVLHEQMLTVAFYE